MADEKKTNESIKATSDNTKKIAAVSNSTLSIEQEQLLILTDISKLVKNISDNIFAGLVVTLPPEAMELLTAPPQVNALAEKEKEKEALLDGEGVKKEARDKLETPFKGILTTLKLILGPMILGFVVGFRKKFDLFTLAITTALLNPIKSLTLLWKAFKFSIEKVANFIKENKLFIWIRSKLFGPMLALFMKIESILQNQTVAKVVTFAKSVVQKFSNFIKPVKDFIQALFEPFRKIFEVGSKLKGMLNIKAFGWIARIGRLGIKAIPVIGWIITAIEGIWGAISGGIEGFKEDGVKGMIRGALVGLVDGLVGWIVDIGQFLVSSLLDLFGFDEAAKIVEQFDFKELLDKYAGFLFPIVGIMDLFDETSEMRKQIDTGIKNLKDAGSFMMDILEATVETIKEILINIGKSIPGGEWLLDKLGIKKEEPSAINKDNIATAREAAVQKAIEEGKSEEEIAAIRSATTVEELRAAAPATAGDRFRAAAKNPLSYVPGIGQVAAAYSMYKADSDEIMAAESAVAPAPSPQQQSQQALAEQQRQNQELAAAPPKAPAPVSSTTVAVDNSSRQAVTYNRELHASKWRESPGSPRMSPI